MTGEYKIFKRFELCNEVRVSIIISWTFKKFDCIELFQFTKIMCFCVDGQYKSLCIVNVNPNELVDNRFVLLPLLVLLLLRLLS